MPSPSFLHTFIFLLAIVLVSYGTLAKKVTLRHDIGLYENDVLEVLNIVLLASVDGKFHALNRSTGNILWSMPSSPPPSSSHRPAQPVPSILEPLVSTKHIDFDGDLDDAQETYIVEPQSGDIYVATSTSPTAPLQRLPFSMAQLVDMTPFSFGEADGRIFMGHKKTSILLIELETGRIKAALDSECLWDAWNNFTEQDVMDIDLDELEGIKPSRQYPSEIFVGRTDYHVSISTRPSSSSSRPPLVHHLSFSTYGPNNQDLEWQATYHQSADDLYIEPLPNGDILSFKARRGIDPATSPPEENQFLWGHRFSNPIVAVFDVVKSSRRASPFVLLQPHLRLRDIFPSTMRQPDFPGDETAFVGLVPETGSLFALSQDHFPFVAFGERPPIQMVEGIEGKSEEGVVVSHEHGDPQCYEGGIDRRSGSHSRIARLLDGVPGPAAPHLPSATGDPTRQGNTNSQAFPGSEQPVVLGDGKTPVVPWQWMVSVPAPRSASWAPSISTILLALTTTVGTLLWFRRATPQRAYARSTPVVGSVSDNELLHKEASAMEAALLKLADYVPYSVPSEPHDVEGNPGTRVILPEDTLPASTEPLLTPETLTTGSTIALDTAILSPAIGDDMKLSPAKAESAEGVEDVGEVKKKHRRRRRRRKGETKDASAEGGEEPENEGDGSEEVYVAVPRTSLVVPPPTPVPPATPSLVVSETVLGYGSHGTVVYQGSLQARAVAVKRLLRDFVTLAHREVNLLKDADDHPNVIRYYYQEAHENFLYIALELCPASLADIIERPDLFRDIAISFNPKRAVRQITSGLRHLHALKIVHRDIKPQNILISGAKKGESNGHRMLISDFGLCRKLELDQTSFLPTAGGAMGVGTFGWRAPEILRGEVKLDETITDDHSQSSRDSISTTTGSNHSGKGKSTTRLTKSVDIFALGCLYYYCLTNGGHPFGDRFEREINIIRDQKSLQGLEGFGEEGSEAVDLINSMLAAEAADRPDTTTCLMHPYFWDPGRRLGFLQDASDRFEIMCRDPRDPHLVLLENNAINVVGPDWPSRLDKIFVENLGKFRKYDGRSVQDLLRALRNKKHHYQDLPDNVKRHVGSMPEGYLSYFTRRYPRLVLHVYSVIANSTLRQESMFRSYFDLVD
ncbi:hypothetical protein B0F90DRAFT_1728628 [Multifurca ochricompacta]|uniref:non-specific serine/threonine protein kinase n=1 Tax=Multifurca ochricompacta TaxID=376703 RepID=A0AAD4M362_9AGAM|nr:hypothetical protein B0F90DRAFT_1728628 [Multifurca ochricompacta]